MMFGQYHESTLQDNFLTYHTACMMTLRDAISNITMYIAMADHKLGKGLWHIAPTDQDTVSRLALTNHAVSSCMNHATHKPTAERFFILIKKCYITFCFVLI